jgi:diguanylate cyclase (GGDEF)-like protein
MVEDLLRRMGRVFGGEGSATARSLAFVWGFGSTCLTVTMLLPHPAQAVEPVLLAVAVVGYLFAAVMFVYAAAIPRAAMEAITYFGQLLITTLSLAWNAPDAPFLWFHVWLVVHSFHFLAPARAMRQVAVAAVLFVAATVASHSPFPGATSAVGVGSLLAVGALVGSFRVQVDELMRASARVASSDPLTGLANRRAFVDAYTRAQAHSSRSGDQGAAVVLLDCDGFKAVNDREGHAAGDLVLQRIATAISASIRELDTAARLGGDEFAILLNSPEPGTAPAIGERIRRAVVDDDRSFGTTISVGIVELPHEGSVDLAAALAAADRAMYESKARGANRVSVGSLDEAFAFAGPRPAERPRSVARL